MLSLVFSLILLQLKLLKVVVKNLSDPAKSSDPKYRQLKMDNAKVKTKITACPAAVPLLLALGFSEEIMSGAVPSPVLRYTSPVVDHAAMSHMFQEISTTLGQLDGPDNAQNKKPKLDASNINIRTNNSTSSAEAPKKVVHAVDHGKMSEKQKARLLKEEKERQERETAKAVRKANVALLKQDKYVRENDDNWTSGVSAACAKSGNSISTFRDKYGE